MTYGVHWWVKNDDPDTLVYCRLCGVVRRRTKRNGGCKGTSYTRVTLRINFHSKYGRGYPRN